MVGKIVNIIKDNLHDLMILAGLIMFVCTMWCIDIIIGWVSLSVILISYGIILSVIKAKTNRK